MKLFFILLACGLVVCCKSKPRPVEQQDGVKTTIVDSVVEPISFDFHVEGTLHGKKSGKVYLSRYEGWTNTDLDSARVKDGKFTFTGKTNQVEQLYVRTENVFKRTSFFVEPGTIILETTLSDIEKNTVSGGEANRLWNEYRATLAAIAKKKINPDNIFQEEEQAREAILQRETANPVAAFIIISEMLWRMEYPALDSALNRFDPAIAGNTYVRALRARANIIKHIATGCVAPDFTLNDTAGHPFTLSSLRGKCVLVDFWASWCAPCRATFPELERLRREYGPRGFEIVGVSLDEKKSAWVNAIQVEKSSWIQVSALKGWPCKVANGTYGVLYIPHSVLLDQEGRIVGTNLEEKKLQEAIVKCLNK